MGITDAELDVLARVGRALADETRRRLLVILLEGPAYPAELGAGLGLGRSNISNHLACLRGCGLVTATQEGRRVRYELSSPRLAHALHDLVSLPLEAACDTGPTGDHAAGHGDADEDEDVDVPA